MIHSYLRSMWGMALRDLRVLRRGLGAFIVRTAMNPVLFIFVFGYVFPRTGQGIDAAGGVGYATVVVPGLVAVAIVFQAITAVALPLSMELSATREIEDRILAPLPIGLVAFEKVLMGAAQGVVAGLVVFPLVTIIPATPVAVHVADWPLLIAVILLATLTSGALGLALGTLVRPQQIGLLFAVVVVPITFLGCVYYPWASLGPIPWLKWLVLLNPLVYMSEGLRIALTPDVPHMPARVVLLALASAATLLTLVGIRTFRRRTIA
ncbi:MAG: ABC transporter permease [Gemmatimonadota bacterium]